MADEYARSLLRVALSMTAQSNPLGGRGFDAIERSASESLLDICVRYLRTIGTLSAQAARHAGRSESNYLDVKLALEEMGVGSLQELGKFARESDLPFARTITPFPVKQTARSSNAAASAQVQPPEARPQYIPDYLPPFPDPATYRHTTTYNQRPRDPQGARKQRSKLKRQAQEALLNLQQSSGQASASALLPSLPAAGGDQGRPTEADEMVDRDTDAAADAASAEGRAAVRHIPDVLSAGQPPVLQATPYSLLLLSTLYSLLSTLYSLLYTLYSILPTPHSLLYTLCVILYTL